MMRTTNAHENLNQKQFNVDSALQITKTSNGQHPCSSHSIEPAPYNRNPTNKSLDQRKQNMNQAVNKSFRLKHFKDKIGKKLYRNGGGQGDFYKSHYLIPTASMLSSSDGKVQQMMAQANSSSSASSKVLMQHQLQQIKNHTMKQHLNLTDLSSSVLMTANVNSSRGPNNVAKVSSIQADNDLHADLRSGPDHRSMPRYGRKITSKQQVFAHGDQKWSNDVVQTKRPSDNGQVLI